MGLRSVPAYYPILSRSMLRAMREKCWEGRARRYAQCDPSFCSSGRRQAVVQMIFDPGYDASLFPITRTDTGATYWRWGQAMRCWDGREPMLLIVPTRKSCLDLVSRRRAFAV